MKRFDLIIIFFFHFLVYVDMGLSSNNPITLTVVTSGSSFSRSFSIKVTQLDCYSLSKGSIQKSSPDFVSALTTRRLPDFWPHVTTRPPDFQTLQHPCARFDNFKDQKSLDYKPVSVTQSKNLLDCKLPGLTNYV